MLSELVYSSVATKQDMGEADLESLLATSRAYNLRAGITGILLFHRREFLQLIEGEQEVVNSLYYDRIASDRRHRSLLVCWEAPVAQRSFADWSMGFARPEGFDSAQTPGLKGYLKSGLQGLDLSGPQSVGRSLLQSIYRQMLATP